ncbi:MAG: DUF167 domain-containing protein [Candidatus Saelkia tenebricola]|nr:DUF167 domain-containing protein [Candidatus Saelkia tenebricola]
MKVTVRVVSGAKKADIRKEADVLRVKIDAPPVEGKANKRLIEILAEYFLVPKSKIKIIKGERSKNKIIQVDKGVK